MRICLLAHAASIHTRRWADFFAGAGHEVHVVSLTPAEASPGTTLHVVGHRRHVHQQRTNWHYLRSLSALRRTLRAIAPDLINAHFLTSNGVLGALTRPPGVPLAISVLGSDVLVIPRRSRLLAAAARWAIRRADLVTTVAEHLTAATRELAGGGRIVTCTYGVDRGTYVPGRDPAERSAVILSNRRLEAVARMPIVLEAMEKLCAAGSPLTLDIVGGGGDEAALRERARSLTESGTVRFVGEGLPTDEMVGRLREAALYVSMTATDGASLSLLEAMACGAFPVVSDIPANRPWIESGVTGRLVPLDDAAALAAALDESWGAPELRRAAAARNATRIAESADFQIGMRELEERFLALTSSR